MDINTTIPRPGTRCHKTMQTANRAAMACRALAVELKETIAREPGGSGEVAELLARANKLRWAAYRAADNAKAMADKRGERSDGYLFQAANKCRHAADRLMVIERSAAAVDVTLGASILTR